MGADSTEWAKTRFIEYTDGTFTTRSRNPSGWEFLVRHSRGSGDDDVIVEFLIAASVPHNMHPHGLRYDKNNEGLFIFLSAEAIGFVPEENTRITGSPRRPAARGRGSRVQSSGGITLSDAPEINAGLLGPIIVTAKGKANPDGSPKDVDREFVASFMIFDQLNGKPAACFTPSTASSSATFRA